MLDTYKDQGARRLLIEELKAKGISNQKVLDAMMKVPRHFFIHQDFKYHAYIDKAFPIGYGQTISQPYTVAYQTQLLHVEPNEKVLEIGTGSGYQAAILAELGANLITVERNEMLYKKTSKLLTKLGYNVKCILSDGSLGYEAEQPYDKIIVTAGAPNIPDSLLNQLKVGGLLVIPVGNNELQTMNTVIKKDIDNYEVIALDDFKFVPLIGTKAW
ncbi:MAG: protein-L-isoaspartate(D-aspartate) O-methyltransferase [Bacteroidia bacterium]